MGNCCTWEDDGDSSTGQSTHWADEAFPDSEDSYDGAEYEPILESAESYNGTAYEPSWEPDSESELSHAGEARSPRPYPFAEALGRDRQLHAHDAHALPDPCGNRCENPRGELPEYDGITIGDPPWYQWPLPPTWPPYTAGCYRRIWLIALPATI